MPCRMLYSMMCPEVCISVSLSPVRHSSAGPADPHQPSKDLSTQNVSAKRCHANIAQSSPPDRAMQGLVSPAEPSRSFQIRTAQQA